MYRQPKKYAVPYRPGFRETVGPFVGALIFVLLLFVMAACVSTSTKAKVTADQVAKQVCTVWTPVTDTTSKQVRGNNRAHYAFCNGPTVENKK